MFTDFVVKIRYKTRMRLVDKVICLLTGLLIAVPCKADTYLMEDFCGSKISLFSKRIYQIELQLSDTDIYGYKQYPYKAAGTCEIKIETWYNSYRKLMIYFEEFDLECSNGHVEFFYYTESVSKVWVKGLEEKVCGEKPSGVYISPTRYLYVKYVPSRSQYTGRLFSVIVTAYRDDSCPRYAYQCKNNRCIDKDVACNGHNSCGDGSGCELGTGAIVGIVIGGLAVVLLIVGIILCRVYKRKKEIQSQTSQDLFVSQAVLQLRNVENSVEYSTPTAGAQFPVQNASVPASNPIPEQQTNGIPDDTPPPSYSELFGNNHQSSVMHEGVIHYYSSSNT